MAYNPTNWKTGDVVTSAKLNNLEKGVKTASILKRIPFMAEGSGTKGFIKDWNGDVPVFYTFNELNELYEESDGALYGYYYGETTSDAESLYLIKRSISQDENPSTIYMNYMVFSVPTSADETSCAIFSAQLTLEDTDEYSASVHSWVFDITNDD